MIRASVLIVEPEPSEALSTRKLVIETGKFNVITAYSGKEALLTLDKFPAIDGVIVHSDIKDVDPAEIAAKAKQQNAKRTVILLRSRDSQQLPGGDHHLSSHEPQALLDLLRELYGDPRGLGRISA
jgi:PleD family two-component response regulator